MCFQLMTPNTHNPLHVAFWQRKFLLQQLLDQDLQRQEAGKDGGGDSHYYMILHLANRNL